MNINSIIKRIKEKITNMVVSRSTQGQNWSYSQVFSAEEMAVPADQRTAINTASDAWSASAVASGFRVKSTSKLEQSLTPVWRDAAGRWSEVNPGDGTPAQGYKVTITGPIG